MHKIPFLIIFLLVSTLYFNCCATIKNKAFLSKIESNNNISYFYPMICVDNITIEKRLDDYIDEFDSDSEDDNEFIIDTTIEDNLSNPKDIFDRTERKHGDTIVNLIKDKLSSMVLSELQLSPDTTLQLYHEIDSIMSDLMNLSYIDNYTLNQNIVSLLSNINDDLILFTRYNGFADVMEQWERDRSIKVINTILSLSGAGFSVSTRESRSKGKRIKNTSFFDIILISNRDKKILYYKKNLLEEEPESVETFKKHIGIIFSDFIKDEKG